MKTSDIPTLDVLRASAAMRERPGRALEILCDATGAPWKVAFRAIEREVDRGLLDVGVSVACAFLTAEGEAFLAKHDDGDGANR